MDVGLGVIGDIIVDYMGDAVNVKASCCNVSCNEDVELSVPQLVNDLLAHLLRNVAVQRVAGKASCRELLGNLLCVILGAHEDEHCVIGLYLEQPCHGVNLVHSGDQPVALAHRRGGLGLRLNPDFDRTVQVPLGNLADRLRHGCGEQHHLPLFRDLAQDPLDVIDEAHAKHLVALIKDNCGKMAGVELLALHQVNDAAGRADNHLHASFESSDLGLV